jgi:putative FmdB family regulatory protein
MPIYEFYCRDCHTIYSFFARRVDTQTTPACPKVPRHKLRRQMSRFAISSGRSDESAGQPGPDMDLDDPKMEQAMMQMAGEMENVNEDDPRAMARMMRKLMETTGMNMGEGMEEAIRRMEAGEDPDKVEEELGDVLDADDPFANGPTANGDTKLRRMHRRLTEAPNVDPEVYDM